ncbi:MAG TPA: hypothetical protein VE596_05485 [Gaiellaceae bacterium]|nr:hypothetical protein [Gaiellaceae bacterium]
MKMTTRFRLVFFNTFSTSLWNNASNCSSLDGASAVVSAVSVLPTRAIAVARNGVARATPGTLARSVFVKSDQRPPFDTSAIANAATAASNVVRATAIARITKSPNHFRAGRWSRTSFLLVYRPSENASSLTPNSSATCERKCRRSGTSAYLKASKRAKATSRSSANLCSSRFARLDLPDPHEP